MADSLDQLDIFQQAIIAQESGGNPTARNSDSGAYGLFQFMPATYRWAAKLAGVSTAWPPSEENQRAAATAAMKYYFEKFGNWRDVAISWYGGEGAVAYSTSAQNASQGKYPSINKYADTVIGRMEGIEADPASSPATTDEIEQMVREQYPEYAWLLDDPEIRDILLEAADPMRGLDEATFNSRIRNSEWYQNSSPAIRQWDTLLSQDPANAKRQLEIKSSSLQRQAQALGVRLTKGELNEMAQKSLRYGWTAIEESNHFAQLLVGDAPAGQVNTTLMQLRNMARQYMVNASENELIKWAQQIATGQATTADFVKGLSDLAKAKFNGNAQMVSMIDQGFSPDAFFADHKRMIADEWGLPVDGIDLRDSRWSGILQTKDDNGVLRPMTLGEARKYSRSQDGWDQTEMGRAVTSDTILGILSKWGKVRV